MPEKKITLLSPAGSWESLSAAIKAGADAVYFGVEQLNMRAGATKPFALKDLAEIVARCRDQGCESYLALNSIVYDQEIALMHNILAEAASAGVNAVIATDIAAIVSSREFGLPVHISTQANISNVQAVRFYAQFAEVMVLARELTLPQIAAINSDIERQQIKSPSGKLVATELFIHGAMCVSISGMCYMSLAGKNASANRGRCLQPCRKRYRVVDEESGEELIVDNRFIMSPKDLCMIGHIDKLIDAGVRVLKIEGRGRTADYVFHTTRAYRQAIDSVQRGDYSAEKIAAWNQELSAVFNRGFWFGGYYLGAKLGEWSGAYGSQATVQKTYLGYINNYFLRPQVAQIVLENRGLSVGDTIAVIGPTTGYEERIITSLFVSEQPAVQAKKGDDVTISFDVKVRRHDKVYLLHPRTNWQS
ncbi:MAG: U32 family peptidase [Calditrichaeota bacterium]|nr:MAG: U32 family peptidase [Calditrichota bacterium]